MAINYNRPQIVTNGLVLCLDAGDVQSYGGSGTTWYDRTLNSYNSDLSAGENNVTWNSNGYMSFAGNGERDTAPAGEHITLNTTATTTLASTKPNGVTYSVWMRFTGDQSHGHGIFYGGTTINHLEYRSSNIANGGYWRTEARTQNGYSFGGGGTDADGGHTLGEWFNLTLVFANSESNHPVRWYRDGTLFHTGYMSNGTNGDNEYFVPSAFGRSTGTDAYQYVQSFKGDMSQLLIYDKALTTSELAQNYNATRGRFGL
jgi:hypothetical protein